MTAFLDSLDIANRGCDHCGVSRISTIDEDSKANTIFAGLYDKLREAELKRNTWLFSIKRTVLRALDTTTMLLDPALYNSTTTYQPGAVVKDADGALWYSTVADNINNAPASTEAWDQYFGPLTVVPFDATISYYAGELVYKLTGGQGGYVVFMSLQNNSGVDPAIATPWAATVTYHEGQTVSYSGSQWWSTIELNINITPADAPLPFDLTAIYSTAQLVTASDGYIYSSTGNGNAGYDPTTDAGVHWTATGNAAAWDRVPTIYPSASTWLPLFAAVRRVSIFYPIGAGPASVSSNSNVFRLPAGYLRNAPKDPKAGSSTYLGAPTGLAYDDWVYEGDYILSRESGPIPLRFVADMKDVRKMDAMFCEGLGCRLGVEGCEPLTQSGSKAAGIEGKYKKFMGEARTANAVQIGAVEPEEDDYINCRR